MATGRIAYVQRCIGLFPNGEFRFQWMVLRWFLPSPKILMIPPATLGFLHS